MRNSFVGRSTGGGEGFVGSGLEPWILATIVALSTCFFLFWGGPLWSTSPQASHLPRIALSYLLIVPLVMASLAVRRSFGLSHLMTSIGIAWAAKLVITATLFVYVAPGTASQYTPAIPWETASTAQKLEVPSAAPVATETGELAGLLSVAGKSIEGAAIVVSGVPPAKGATPPPKREVKIQIRHAGYDRALFLANVGDALVVANHDASLHTLRATQETRAAWNVPVLGITSPPIALTDAGIFELACGNHASEHATLVVVDHPLAVVTDASGRFAIKGIAAGERTLVVVRHGQAPVRRTIRVVAGARVDLNISLEGDKT